MRLLRFVLLCLAVLLVSPIFAQRSICITIDDLPFVSQVHTLAWQQTHTKKLLQTLEADSVPAIGFVNEKKLMEKGTVYPGRVALLQAWLDAGQELGNHTYSHPDYHRLSFPEFQADIEAGEGQTKALLEKEGQQLRYFRHPFLHTGNSPEKQQALADYLKQAGYTVAPVSMDNAEWIFARAYENAVLKKDGTMAQRIGLAYVDYLIAQAAYYEGQAQALFGRDIRHILLIHANLLNADYLDEVLAAFKTRGYQFISLAKALEDEAYQSEDTYTGMGGISWLHRWAITRGVEKGFFAGEVRCPDFVQEVAGIKE